MASSSYSHIWVYYEFRKIDRCEATGPVLDQRLLAARIAGFNLIVIHKLHEIVIPETIRKDHARLCPVIAVFDHRLKNLNGCYIVLDLVPTVIALLMKHYDFTGFVILLNCFHEFIVNLQRKVRFFNYPVL